MKNPRQADTGGVEVDKMEVAFRQRMPYDKKLVISVRANGEAHVSISTSSVSQARQYVLNVLEVTSHGRSQILSDQVEDVALADAEPLRNCGSRVRLDLRLLIPHLRGRIYSCASARLRSSWPSTVPSIFSLYF